MRDHASSHMDQSSRRMFKAIEVTMLEERV